MELTVANDLEKSLFGKNSPKLGRKKRKAYRSKPVKWSKRLCIRVRSTTQGSLNKKTGTKVPELPNLTAYEDYNIFIKTMIFTNWL
jgi:hypothetical protein